MDIQVLDHLALWSYSCLDLLADPDQAHVWRVQLDLETEQIADLEQSLSSEERARADRFRSVGDRSRYVAARGSLRALLAHYLHLQPRQVQFSYTAEKKPILSGGESLHFNLSHSETLALIAVSPRRAVGIDLEHLRSDFEPEPLAKRFFARSEYAALLRVPSAERHRAFLACWTCKEAYLKAAGMGLRSPLNQFAVSLKDYSVRLVGPTGEGTRAAPYCLQPLYPSPEYVAALALADGGEGEKPGRDKEIA